MVGIQFFQCRKFSVADTSFFDDATGPDDIPLPIDIAAAMRGIRLASTAPVRLQPSGSNRLASMTNANWGQQVYFFEATTRAV
ncbi:MAG: hypothetical protein AB7F79_02915 [Steroidobacteraceae bacterium]